MAGILALKEQAKTIPFPPLSRPERNFTVHAFGAPLAEKPIWIETLNENNSLQVKRMHIQANQSLAEHWSPYAIQLICLAGSGWFEANGERVALHPQQQLVSLSPALHYSLQAAVTESLDMLMLFQKVPSVTQRI